MMMSKLLLEKLVSCYLRLFLFLSFLIFSYRCRICAVFGVCASGEPCSGHNYLAYL